MANSYSQHITPNLISYEYKALHEKASFFIGGLLFTSIDDIYTLVLDIYSSFKTEGISLE